MNDQIPDHDSQLNAAYQRDMDSQEADPEEDESEGEDLQQEDWEED